MFGSGLLAPQSPGAEKEAKLARAYQKNWRGSYQDSASRALTKNKGDVFISAPKRKGFSISLPEETSFGCTEEPESRTA